MNHSSLNHVFRLVWNEATQAFVPVAEIARACGKRGRGQRSLSILAAASLAISGAYAADLPTNGTIVAGAGSISQTGSNMTITQSTSKMVADWQSFSIGQGSTVTFEQPSASSVALNRVLGSDVSVIQGALNANGRVFLVNPNGIMFSSTARVDVGSLVASTLDISTEDFMAGNYNFAGDSANAVINQGNITTTEGGLVAMIAARIINTGSITTPQGSTLMGAGSKVILDLGGPVKIEVIEALLDTYIEQGGAIKADGGLVFLTAKAAGELTSSVINHTGITEAQTLASGENGEIFLMGDMESGVVQVAGTLDASAPNEGDGGFIETSAAKVEIQPELKVTTKAENGKTGEWLIDPEDFTVAEADGDITGTALSGLLADNNITIQTVIGTNDATNLFATKDGNGDIFVNDEITWSSGNTLTLNAIRNIEINAAIDASGGGGGKLVLEYGQGAVTTENAAFYAINAPVSLQAGQNYTTKLGSDGALVEYTVIIDLGTQDSTTGTDLQGINGALTGNFALGAAIDASSTSGWDSEAGFNPIGNDTDKFSGKFDGLGHTISGLTINRTAKEYVGLFGYASGATLRNVGLVDGSVTGWRRVGGLVGYSESSAISNVYTTGIVSGESFNIGGLVGTATHTTISNVFASGEVSGNSTVGGLVGFNWFGSISNSYATGKVSGTADYVGGLAGFSDSINFSDSYATGDVSGTDHVGGLVGTSKSTIISNAYATGKVLGADYVGGLVGSNRANHENGSSATISNAYATGSVSGDNHVGGLVGSNSAEPDLPGEGHWESVSATISNAYATGDVSGNSNVGGLVGSNISAVAETEPGCIMCQQGPTYYATISNAYATGSTTGVTYVGALVGHNNWRSTVTHSYWNTDTNTPASSGIGLDDNSQTVTGLTTDEMLNAANFIGFNFTAPWSIKEGQTSPYITAHSRHSVLLGDGVAYWSVKTVDELQAMASDLASNYVLFTDIDATVTSEWNPQGDGTYAGFDPLGVFNLAFSGKFDGLGHTISGLTINRTEKQDVGLFGYTFGATLRNVGLVDGSVSGRHAVGGLVGRTESSVISNSYTTGSVSGTHNMVGGLVGLNYNSTISNVYTTGNVKGTTEVGGLVGMNSALSSSPSIISNAYATGEVEGSDVVGGLVGENRFNSAISNAYATGNVKGTGTGTKVGGLVGYNRSSGTISASYWKTDNNAELSGIGLNDNVNIQPVVTGLTTADMQSPFIFIDAGWDFASVWGKSNSSENDGYMMLRGVGASTLYDDYVRLSGDTSKTYGDANPELTGITLDGLGTDTITLAWNDAITTSTNADSYAYADGNVIDVTPTSGGGAYVDYGTGKLTIGKAALSITADNAEKTYDGQAFTGGNGVTYDGFVNSETVSDLTGNITYGGTAQNAVNADSYIITASGLTSGNYDITYNNGTLTVDPAAITAITGIIANNKTYDGTYHATLDSSNAVFTGMITGDTLTIAAAGVFTDKNVGTGITVNITGLTLSGTDAGNYSLTDTSATTTADITPAALSITANDAEKTYDGLAFTGGNGVTYDGFVNSETDSVLTGNIAYGGTAQNALNADSYTITASGQTSSNYNISYTDGTLIIDKANATVTANSATTTYSGVEQSVSGYTVAGLVNDENAADVLSLTETGGSGTNAGSYTLNIAGDATNYNLTFVDGELTIDKANATVTANSATTTYSGVEQSVSGYTVAGLVNDETASVLNLTESGGAGTNAGSYTLNIDGDAANYTLTFVNGELTITRRPITVTAEGKNKLEGEVDPALTFLVEEFAANRGLVEGDTISGELARESGENPGEYDIQQGTVTSASNPNYDVEFEKATLEIKAVDPVDQSPEPTPAPTGSDPILKAAQQSTQQIGRSNLPQTTSNVGPLQQGPAPSTGGQQRVGQIGSLDVVELDSSEFGELVGSQTDQPQGGGPLTMFVVDGGINEGNQGSDSSDDTDEPAEQEVTN